MTEITTAVTKDPNSDSCVAVSPDNGRPIYLSGIPSSAITALSWFGHPLLINGDLTIELIESPDGTMIERQYLDIHSLADPNPPSAITEQEELYGIVFRTPYGLYLRDSKNQPLRIGGPFTAFLERLTKARLRLKLQGQWRDGSFLAVKVDLRPDILG